MGAAPTPCPQSPQLPPTYLPTYPSPFSSQGLWACFFILPCQGSSTQLCSCPHLGALAFRMTQHLLGGCGCSYLLMETEVWTGYMPHSPEMRLP